MMIKVCGMRDAENIREVEALGIDLMGFIFWPKSSRYVSERPTYLPTQCKRVGVFVDEDIETVTRIADEYALDFVQLHGHETPSYCAQLNGKHLIKAFNIATAADFEATKPYEGIVDHFLFDTKGKSVGGNGEKFDWNVLKDYVGETPFLLSGGIGPDDAELLTSFSDQGQSVALRTLLSLTSKNCIGIDLNSKFEDAPALKNIQKLKTFLEQL